MSMLLWLFVHMRCIRKISISLGSGICAHAKKIGYICSMLGNTCLYSSVRFLFTVEFLSMKLLWLVYMHRNLHFTRYRSRCRKSGSSRLCFSVVGSLRSPNSMWLTSQFVIFIPCALRARIYGLDWTYKNVRNKLINYWKQN